MDKKKVYQQINQFKLQMAKDYDKKDIKDVDKFYWYVSDEEANDKAQFIKYLIEKNFLDIQYKNILDLTFGSGNLTSHIVLDSNIQYNNIIFNDLNTVKTNQNIVNVIDNSSVESLNILDIDNFHENESDLIIFNPQIGGGTYPEGDISLGKSEKELFEQLFSLVDIFLSKNKTLIFYGRTQHFEKIFKDYNFINYQNGINQLYIISKTFEKIKCFQKIEDTYEEIDCNNQILNDNDEVEDFDNLDLALNSCNDSKEEDDDKKKQIGKIKFSNESKGNLDFSYKNILFKGVPGTGKSETIKNIITDKLDMKELTDNVLRINIHSASSNSDLMQGISISTTKDNENVLYREKQGAILNHIFKAIYKPKQPFVLVLEEIQENSLNELIGDLIYLIEDKKRTVVNLDIPNNTEIAYDELFEKINKKAKEDDKSLDYVELPSLVENSQNNTKMIVPDNLFIFCTSNYRDDKKVIEDNLLRRFDVIEIYPKYDGIYKSKDIPKFLEKLNNQILEQFNDEIHPDRYLIGHANWLDIQEDSENSQIAFYKALLKVIIEFKEIREIDFDSEVKPTLEKVFKDVKLISDRLERYLEIFYNNAKLELKSYKHIVDLLQKEIYKSFL